MGRSPSETDMDSNRTYVESILGSGRFTRVIGVSVDQGPYE